MMKSTIKTPARFNPEMCAQTHVKEYTYLIVGSSTITAKAQENQREISL